MTGMPPTLQALVGAALDRLENEARDRGERWSVRTLEERHALSNGTLGQIAKGKRKAVDPPTAKKVAAALGLALPEVTAALALAEDEEPGNDSADLSPPNSSGVVVRETDAELLDDAFDGERHKPSDLAAVQRLLREKAALMAPGIEPVQIVRRWLDAAARIRGRGEKANPSKIIAELTARVVQLEESERRPVPAAVKALQGRKKAERDE